MQISCFFLNYERKRTSKKYEMLVYTVESTYLYRKYFNLFT